MPTSCAPTTQSRNHRERVLAQDARNTAAFLIADVLKSRCNKTAVEMRAEMDGWGTETGTPQTTAFGKVCDEYNAAKFGPAKGAVSEIVAAEIPATAHVAPFVTPQVRPARASSVVSVPVESEAPEAVATVARQDEKPVAPITTLAAANEAIHSGVWHDLDEVTQAEYANALIASYLWDRLTVQQKAIVAMPISYIEAAQGDPKTAYVQSVHSLFRAIAQKRTPKMETYRLEWIEKTGVVRCNCEAGSRHEDCYHAMMFVHRFGTEIEQVYQKSPRLVSEISNAERVADIDVSPAQKAKDFD